MTAAKESDGARRRARYIPADFYLLRAPLLPASCFQQLTSVGLSAVTPDSAEDEAYDQMIQQCHAQIRSFLTQSPVEYAMGLASLSILEGLQRLDQSSPRRTAHTFSRLLRYLVRMCSRPTPFGLFAGVAVGAFAETTSAQLACPPIHHTRARPDMHWLYEIIRQVEQIPALVEQLLVTTNQTIHIVNGRATLPVADVQEQQDARSISLRLTATVQFVFEQAHSPIRYADLREKLLQAFPRAELAQVERLLWQLWEHNFLVSDLRPPLTHESPARYVLDHLRHLSGAEKMVSLLQVVFDDLQALDRAGGQGSLPLLRNLIEHQEQLVPGAANQQQPFQIDAALHPRSLTLHQDIGQAAARIAELLSRLMRRSLRAPHLQHYYDAFLEHYGMYREVPLLDLLSPETGLGAPATYQNPPSPHLPPAAQSDSAEYDAVLHALVLQAVNERKLEVELTEEHIRQLEQEAPEGEELLPSVEIYFQIHASSQASLDRGKWRAVLSPICGSPVGGRTFGRFCDLLSPNDIAALQHFTRHVEELYPDVVFAELSYLHQAKRTANVAIRPQLHEYEIVVGVTPSVPLDHVIPLDDLVVGVRDGHFYVRSLRLGKEVIACQTHMLNITGAPNVCRFLLELHSYRFAPFSHFDWGSAESMPFTPRLTYQNIVLHPARWNLLQGTIVPSGNGSERVRWLNGLRRWRTAWRVPRYVYLRFMDNRLLLDLEHPCMVEELREELEKLPAQGRLTLEELLPDFEHLWLEDERGEKYFSEVVIPLRRAEARTAPRSSGMRIYQVSGSPITQLERDCFPGDPWIYLKLYAAHTQHEELIAGPMRELVRTLQQQRLIDRWFFLRYMDSGPHIRLRLHACNEQTLQPALMEALAWGRRLAQRGQIRTFCLDTYEREVERYGGPKAIDVIEHAFMADSVTTSSLIAACYHRQVNIDAIALAVFSVDRLLADWGLDLSARWHWAREHIAKDHHKEFHAMRRTLCDLIAPWQHTNDPALMEQRELLCTLVSSQKPVIEAVAGHIHTLAKAGDLCLPEPLLLRSLAHMHINRLLEKGFQKEPQIYSFWRQTLESLSLRSGASSRTR